MGNTDIAGLIFTEACITQTILIVLFLLTILRAFMRAKLNFIITICALLAITALSWIFECRTNVKYFETSFEPDTSCHAQQNAETRRLCRVYLFWEAVNTCSFNIAIWLFAIRYWLLAKRIEEGTISQYQKITWIGCLVMVVESLIASVTNYYRKKETIFVAIEALIWISIAGILAAGLRRIRRLMS